MTSCSCLRNSPGAVSACAAAFFLSASACWKSGSLDCASCCSLTSASAISWLACCLPASRLSCSGGAGFGTAPAAGIAGAGPCCSGPIGGDRLRHRLGRVGRGGGGGLDVFGLPLLALGYQALDLALDLAGLARLRVVVGLLQRLRRLRLDGRLDRRDERLLVERARLLGVHRGDLRRLGLPGHVIGRGERGVLGLFRLRRGRRVRALVLGESLHIPGDLFERRILFWSNGFRRDRWLQQLVGRQWSSGDCGSTAAAGGRRRWRRAPRATTACLGALGRGLAERTYLWHRLSRGHRLFRRDRSGPEARLRHRERRRRRLRTLQFYGYTGRLGALEALLHRVDRGFVAAQFPQRRVDVSAAPPRRATSISPASSALTAALPALRCSAKRRGGAHRGRARPRRSCVYRRRVRR